MFVQSMKNPRMALSAHVGGLMSGLFLGVIGAAWDEVRLSQRLETATYWLALAGAYGGSLTPVLAAVLGTSSSTPIAGAGYGASAAKEAIVTLALTLFAIPQLLSCVFLLIGFRRAR
jgi:hydroxylaminobenzene mutase